MIGGARIRGIMALAALWAGLVQGCSPYEWRHENQWESRDQIWLSEASQVKIRAAQSRVFETADRLKTLQAVVSTFQDLGFTIEVSDEVLNIVSGRKFAELEGAQWWSDPTYYMYRDDGLLLFTRQYHSWGPFYHRSDLVRLTATVRPRGETQVVVRASAQYYLGAVENPEPYQRFFRTLEQALFLQANAVQ